jgi:hypothetical protein
MIKHYLNTIIIGDTMKSEEMRDKAMDLFRKGFH